KDNVEKVEILTPAGDYQIIVSHKNTLLSGFQDFSLVVTGIDNTLNVDSKIYNDSVSVSPNPTSDFLYFISSESNISIDKVEIYDTIGKRVFASELNNNSIDISNLTPGVYMVKIYSEDGGYVTKKIIKK